MPAYVDKERDDGKLDISLRPLGRAKTQESTQQILQALLEAAAAGMDTLDVGDKSTPAAVAAQFPGMSKVTFKKAVATLYREGKVQPGPYSIRLMNQDDQ